MTQESTPTLEPWKRCRIGSCQRHRDCMYQPCRAGQTVPELQERGFQESTPPASQSNEALVGKLRLIAVWHTPGAKTPAQPMPDVAKVCQTAADALSVSRNCNGISDAREAAAEAKGRREGIEEAAKVAESAMFNEYGRPQPVLVARLRALAEKQP